MTFKQETVDLGCGNDKNGDDALGVDIRDTADTDLVHDLENTPWPLPSNQFHTVYCHDILEHVATPLQFLEEVHRITVDGARVYIRVPHFTSTDTYIDPTHERGYSVQSFFKYTYPDGDFNWYTDAVFDVVDWTLQFPRKRVQPWNKAVSYVANKRPHLYESTILRSLSPAGNLYVTLEPVKQV